MADGKSQAKDKFNQSGAKSAPIIKMGGGNPGKRYGQDPYKRVKGGK